MASDDPDASLHDPAAASGQRRNHPAKDKNQEKAVMKKA